MRTLLSEGRMAPPFASTKASLAEQSMKSTILPAPVQRSSDNGPVILKMNLKRMSCITGLVVRPGVGIEPENENTGDPGLQLCDSNLVQIVI